ncbi:MAG TPA: permease-like cell division protein FtsX [Candidatus Polarisedimenticolaceae bacterium]
MRRWISLLRYFAEDALDEWRHSPGAAVLATATVAAVLFVGGLALLVGANVRASLEAWSRDARVEIYLAEGASATAIDGVRARLEALPGVSRVVFVGKDEALRRFRLVFRSLADLPAELGENPLPASFEAYVEPGPAADETARLVEAAVGSEPVVEEVRFDRAMLARVESMLGVARWGVGGIGALVAAAVIFVVAGVTRLAVYARRDEVDVMLLVGATPSFVRGPFLLAGAAQGLLAALVALGSVELARRTALAYSGADPAALVGLALGRPLPASAAGALLAAGVAVGLASSWAAVRGARE